MFFGIITLLTALSMATVAAVFAIYGIIAIFAGMPQFALVMGAVIELGKVVGISWLYRNWNEPTKIKYAMAPLVLVAMMLTSMGIFGLLSKAHLEQTSPVANNEIQIERLDQQIAREQSRIADSEEVISQLDQTVQTLLDFDRVRGADGALAVRETQAEQRELLRQTIDTAQTEIDRLEDQKLELTQELRAVELEVGPVKYLAELIYGTETDRTEEAVRWVIIAFIFVFDPMAILLLMAANYTFTQRQTKKAEKQNDKPVASEPVYTPPQPVVETIKEEPQPEPIKPQQELPPDIPMPEPEPVNEPEPEPENISLPSAADDAAVVIAESADISVSKKKLPEKDVATEGVTPLHDVGGGYVEFGNQLFKKEALQELRPDLFSLKVDGSMPSTNFGTHFPRIAKKKDIFVRVDMLPNKVYRFDGSKWIEINKEVTQSYLHDNEYIKFLVNKISTGEYDIELLSEHEKIQIEEYLKDIP